MHIPSLPGLGLEIIIATDIPSLPGLGLEIIVIATDMPSLRESVSKFVSFSFVFEYFLLIKYYYYKDFLWRPNPEGGDMIIVIVW